MAWCLSRLSLFVIFSVVCQLAGETICPILCLYNLQARTQQHNIILAFKLTTLSTMSEDNGCHVSLLHDIFITESISWITVKKYNIYWWNTYSELVKSAVQYLYLPGATVPPELVFSATWQLLKWTNSLASITWLRHDYYHKNNQ